MSLGCLSLSTHISFTHSCHCVIMALSLQYGTTPLIWAARKGHYDSVMHLLANGADVDQEGAVSRLYIYIIPYNATIIYVMVAFN